MPTKPTATASKSSNKFSTIFYQLEPKQVFYLFYQLEPNWGYYQFSIRKLKSVLLATFLYIFAESFKKYTVIEEIDYADRLQ